MVIDMVTKDILNRLEIDVFYNNSEFRVYDINKQRFVENVCLMNDGVMYNYLLSEEVEDYIITFEIGKKDRKGNKIFELDILENKKGQRTLVQFNSKEFTAYNRSYDSYYTDALIKPERNALKIGNLFEDTHLLEDCNIFRLDQHRRDIDVMEVIRDG